MPIHLGSGNVRTFAEESTPFDVTLAIAGTAEDAVVPPTGKAIRRVNIVNHGPGTAFVEFDGTATVASLEVEQRGSYDEADIGVSTNISFIGETGRKPRVTGVVWSN